jgi:hypothetical protein
MTATLHWFENSILVCEFTGPFGVENYAVMEGQLPMTVREKTERVDVIFHLKRGAGLPNLKGIMPEIRILTNVMPPNFGVFVGVGEHFLLGNAVAVLLAGQMVKRVLKGTLKDKVFVASSLPQAQKLILAKRGLA